MMRTDVQDHLKLHFLILALYFKKQYELPPFFVDSNALHLYLLFKPLLMPGCAKLDEDKDLSHLVVLTQNRPCPWKLSCCLKKRCGDAIFFVYTS